MQKPLPKQRDPKRVFPWRFEISDSKGKVVYRAGLADPTEIRGEFANPGDPTKIDLVRFKAKDPVHLHHPRAIAQEATEITFFALDETQGRSDGSPAERLPAPRARELPKLGAPGMRPAPTCWGCSCVHCGPGLAYEVETIQDNGDPANRYDILDARRRLPAAQQAKMTSDTNWFLGGFWASSPSPSTAATSTSSSST